ncbi:MAG: flagellar hook-basal body complex protein, partial [bacterium]
MLGSLFTGISGLSVNARNMQVIGDNIANVNTTAFKSNRSIFGNIMTQSLEGGEFRKLGIGRGVQTLATDQIWTQGSIETTSKSTDLAINGKGFFIVHEVTPEGVTEVKYTRAGAFNFDADGYMVNPDGLILAGYQVDPETGVVGNDVVDISLPAGTAPPR